MGCYILFVSLYSVIHLDGLEIDFFNEFKERFVLLIIMFILGECQIDLSF